MDLTLRTQPFTTANQKWLGSATGTGDGDTITLDGVLTGAVFTTGIVPDGLCLGKVTATGRYAPYVDGASDGTEVAVGFLLTPVELLQVLRGDAAGTYHNVQGVLMWHGEVVVANLPVNHGLDTAGKADLAAKFRFV